jgi:hypothetical protein
LPLPWNPVSEAPKLSTSAMLGSSSCNVSRTDWEKIAPAELIE